MLIVEEDNNEKKWFSSNVMVIDYTLKEMGINQKPEIIPITFDPEKVLRFNPADYEDFNGFAQTYIDMQGANGVTIDCDYNTFKKTLFNYKNSK